MQLKRQLNHQRCVQSKFRGIRPKNPLQIAAYKGKDNFDAHLFEVFYSDGSLGFGANGLAVDGLGNLYTGIMEEGTVYKTTISKMALNNQPRYLVKA
ncbi:hypothetical protein P4S68_17075 [Pseudoalteromonas sp. Hal099]